MYLIYLDTVDFSKGGLIPDIFHFGSNLKKKAQNHCPEHYPPKEKLLRTVIWHIF